MNQRKKFNKRKVAVTTHLNDLSQPLQQATQSLPAINPGKKGIFSHIAEEFARHEVLVAISTFLFSPFTIISAIISVYSLWELTLPKIAAYLVAHPTRALIALIFFALLAPFINGGVRAIFRLCWGWIKRLFSPKGEAIQANNSEPANDHKALALYAGISSFSPHATKKDKREDWQQCRQQIESAKDLRIMGATGWDTFASPEAPLHSLIKKFKGDIKILMLDKNAQAVIENRALELSRAHRDYSEEIEKSIAFLTALKKTKTDFQIEVRMYKKPLVWKMIICNSYMWLQHYWSEKNVDDSPVYTFFSDGAENPTSLFHPFYSEWQRLWTEAEPHSF
jgi:hypothetical protein